MDMVSEISNGSDWLMYQSKILGSFRKVNLSYHRQKEALQIMENISELTVAAMNAEIDYRREKKESFKTKEQNYYRQANELLEILNEQVVLEILMGD